MTTLDRISESIVDQWLAIVGIGEDGVEGLTVEARALVERAELVVGGRRHLALAAPLVKGDSMEWASPITDTLPAILAWRGRPVTVLASGDPFFYGIGSTLGAQIPASEMIVRPVLSSAALAQARLGWAAQKTATVSLCGRPLETLRPHLHCGTRLLVLSADETTPSQVAGYLTALGFGASTMLVLEALGGPNERHRTTTPDTFDLKDVDRLNIIALDLEAAPGHRGLPCVPGRRETWFEHDGQITKSEVRAITLASLDPAPGERLWDVGCGSGSIGIEWLLACATAEAIAIDKNPERLQRTVRNAASLGVPRLDPRCGPAPEIFVNLPSPNAIFVGGGGSDTDLLEAAWQNLAPGGRLVANGVTLETQSILTEWFRRLGGRLIRIGIEHAEPVGRLHGYRPAMPVLHYAVTKQ